MVPCGELLFTCPSQTQNPLTDQCRHITRLGSLRLDQNKLRLTPKVTRLGSLRLDYDKLRLAPEVRSFHFSIMSNKMDKPNQLDLSDELTMSNEMDISSRLDLLDEQIILVKPSWFLTYIVNHTWCQSKGLDVWCLSVDLDVWCLSDGLDVIYI